MNPIIHGHGLLYEHLMCRAFQCWPSQRNGAHAGHYHAIYWSLHGYLPRKNNHVREVENVKKYLEKALNGFMRRRLQKAERETLLGFLTQLEAAQNEEHLFSIVENCLTATRRFADYRPS